MEVWAHRGRASPSELGNSIINFINAYHLGVTGIEADISFTADKKIIIYHPGSIKPDLVDFTWQEIENSIFRPIRLETLLELLKFSPGLMLSLDIKQNSEELVEKAVEAVITRKLEDRVYFTTFRKRMPWLTLESGGELLLKARKVCPNIKTHVIVPFPANLQKVVDLYNPDAISIGWLLEPYIIHLISLNLFMIADKKSDLKRQISEIKGSGKKIWAGIFNDAKDIQYFIDLGVDGIITDNPAKILDLTGN